MQNFEQTACVRRGPNFSSIVIFNNFELKICATRQLDFLPKMWYHLTMEGR